MMYAKFSYQTLHLPPPFAFAYTMELTFSGVLEADFQLEYLNRETLSPEEIEEEGFTENDDFGWKGQLDAVWIEILSGWISAAKTTRDSPSETTWIYLETDEKKGSLKETDEWEYRLQQIIQAIYEQSGHERPLRVKLVHRKNRVDSLYELTASFARRTSRLNGKHLAWEDMQELLSRVFALDFKDETVSQPQHDGFWIDAGDSSDFQEILLPNGKKGEQLRSDVLSLLTRPRT